MNKKFIFPVLLFLVNVISININGAQADDDLRKYGHTNYYGTYSFAALETLEQIKKKDPHGKIINRHSPDSTYYTSIGGLVVEEKWISSDVIKDVTKIKMGDYVSVNILKYSPFSFYYAVPDSKITRHNDDNATIIMPGVLKISWYDKKFGTLNYHLAHRDGLG